MKLRRNCSITQRMLVALTASMAATTALVSFPPTAGATSPGAVPRNQTLIFDQQLSTSAALNANPFVPATNLGDGLDQAVYESLFYLNYQTGKLVPWLATGYKFNSNFTEVTITTRPGVTWSDGYPFTARDVAFTVNMLVSHPNLLYSLAGTVKSATATNARTVVINLTKPDPNFVIDTFGVNIATSTVIVPQHIWQGKNPETFTYYDPAKGWPVGTGPYTLTKLTSTTAVFDRDPNWWAAKIHFHALPAPRRIEVIRAGTTDTTAALLRSNGLDVSRIYAPSTFLSVLHGDSHLISWSKSAPYGWLDPCPHVFIFNTTVKPWNNPVLRQAVEHGFDRARLAQLAGDGTALPASFLWVNQYPALAGYVEKNASALQKGLAYDPSLSQKLFTQAGYKRGPNGYLVGRGGEPLKMQLVMLNAADGGAEWVTLSGYDAQALRSMGIDASVKSVSFSAYLNDLLDGNFGATETWDCGSTSNPYQTMYNLSNSPRNYAPIGKPLPSGNNAGDIGRWTNSTFTSLVSKMGMTLPTDTARLSSLFSLAVRIYLSQMPAFGLFEPTDPVVMNTTYWRNWPTASNPYVQPTYWWATFHQVLLALKRA